MSTFEESGEALRPDWEVSQCSNGCIHLRLQSVTLTFSADEFAKLYRLVERAMEVLQLGLETSGYTRMTTPH